MELFWNHTVHLKRFPKNTFLLDDYYHGTVIGPPSVPTKSRKPGRESFWDPFQQALRILANHAAIFLLVIAVTIIAFGALKLLRAMGVDDQQVKLLESIDQITIAILIALFCLDVIMTAASIVFGRRK